MILGVFIEFFGLKKVIGLSKNRCDLFLTVGFDFGSNMTVGSHIFVRNHFGPLDQASDLKLTVE